MARFFGPVGGPLWVHDLFWLLIVVAVVVGVILIVRLFLERRPMPGGRWGAAPPPWQHHNPALHELDLRYARGEVDRTEYLQRRADLLGHPAPPDDPGRTPSA